MSKQLILPPVPRTPIGEIRIWLTGLGVATGLIMVFGFLSIILYNGLDAFWPRDAYVFTIKKQGDPDTVETVYGSIARDTERHDDSGAVIPEYQLFTGSKDVYGQSFRYVDKSDVISQEADPALMELERLSGGKAIVKPLSLTAGGKIIPVGSPKFETALDRCISEAETARRQVDRIQKSEIAVINEHLDEAGRDLKALDMSYRFDDDRGLVTAIARDNPIVTSDDPVRERRDLQERIARLQGDYERSATHMADIEKSERGALLDYQLGDGTKRQVAVDNIVSCTRPNSLGVTGKLTAFASRIWNFVTEDPREANTEGGVFPAIFGTFVMTVLMSALVTPVGVIAAIYLREYARQGPLVRLVRICVNNLAGVPSIVFGVFGLGFFVYFVGGGIDQLLFSKKLAVSQAPTFGTSGVLWASLTLALMTLPVVIVSTEEALSSVPRGLREAALACGASKWQMIQRIILPGALPGVLTGIILAMARGAGEVAPLMLTGVVKLAPNLPIDMDAPFLHLERKFMHLGFHIYDVGFQSPDSDAARSMVFATTLLLILLVIVMNLTAIIIRNKLRKKHQLSSF